MTTKTAEATTHIDGITYELKMVDCGKGSRGCKKCKTGPGHGPYWYAYWTTDGKTRTKYIGKNLPEPAQHPQEADATTTGPCHVCNGIGHYPYHKTPCRTCAGTGTLTPERRQPLGIDFAGYKDTYKDPAGRKWKIVIENTSHTNRDGQTHLAQHYTANRQGSGSMGASGPIVPGETLESVLASLYQWIDENAYRQNPLLTKHQHNLLSHRNG